MSQLVSVALAAMVSSCALAEDAPQFDRQIAPLLKAHCVKCHGPAKQEAKLNLSTPADLIRGNEQGAILVPHDLQATLLKALGVDHRQLTYPHDGRETSLTDAEVTKASVNRELLALCPT